MQQQPDFSFITWVNDENIYGNLVKSCDKFNCEFIAMDQKYKNMAAAYNAGTDVARGKFLVYCHQDIEVIDTQFDSKIFHAFHKYKDIGFLGVIGSVTNYNKRLWFNEPPNSARGMILQGNSFGGHGSYNGIARILDGLIMITDKKIDFPEFLPGIHCLDSFMCLRAEQMGYRNWISPIVIRHWSEGDVASPQIESNYDLIMKNIIQNYTMENNTSTFNADQAMLYAEGLSKLDGSNLTVIIPVINQIHHTVECINSLIEDVPEVKIILIDNNSTDETEYIIKNNYPWIKYIKNKENAGVSASWNQGIRMASTPLVCVLNNDTIIKKRGMRLLIREAMRTGASTTIGRRLNGNFTCGHYTEDVDKMHYPEAFVLVITQDTYKKIGPFDERFWPAYSEDADYGIRMKIADLQCSIVPESIIHKGSVTASTMNNISNYLSVNTEKLRNKWQNNPGIHSIF